MNLVEWEVSIPAVRMVISSALTTVALPLLIEMTLYVIFVLFRKVSCTFQKSFKNSKHRFTFLVGVLGHVTSTIR